MLTEDQRTYIKAFYCQGGFNHEKMNLPSRLAMKAFIAVFKKSKNEKEREVRCHRGKGIQQGHVERRQRRSISYTQQPLFRYLISRNIYNRDSFTEIYEV